MPSAATPRSNRSAFAALSVGAVIFSGDAGTDAFVSPRDRLVLCSSMSQAPCWNAQWCGVSSCRFNRENGRRFMSLQPPQLEEDQALPQSPPEDPKEGLTTEIEFFEPPLAASQNSSPLPARDKDDYLHHPHEPVHHFIEVIENEPTTDLAIGIWTARALLLLVAVLWGTNFASIKYLETLCFHPPCNHPPSEAALARFGVAAAVSLPLLYKQNKDVIFAGLECGLWISMGYIAQAMALETISSGKCAFICSLTVVVVPVIEAIFFGRKIKPVNVISAVLALTGIGVLEGLIDVNSLVGVQPALADGAVASLASAAPAATNAAASSSATMAAESTGWLASTAASLGLGKGDLLALGQPVGFGLSFLRIEHYVEKFKKVDNRVLTMAAAQCVMVGIISLLWVLYDFHGKIPNMGYMLEPHRVGAIAWTGIMTTVVAIYFEGIALQVASATEAALTFSSEPVWASLFGAWLLHERLNTSSYVGGSIILLACVLGALADLTGGVEEEKIEAEQQ